MARATICLSMIVKNEAHCIERCLASVKPLIDHWIVVDTGSTDGTQALVRKALAGIPGEVVERPWKNFAANRSEALALSRGHATYSLVIDADDALELPAGYALPELTLGAYSLHIEYNDYSYDRVQLLRNDLNWRYEGVVHEAPATNATFDSALLRGPIYRIHGGGARSRDPKRFERDAELLAAALVEDPTNERHQFYLGQSYRDAGMFREARDAYAKRATMGGWDEQVYYSLFQVAILAERLNEPRPTVWAAYLEAYRARPTRAETLVELARYCRVGGEYHLAFMFAQTAAMLPRPNDALFVHDATYRWRALDELAIAAFYAGHLDISAASSAKLLTEGRVPASELERVKRNLTLIATQKARPAP